MTMTLLPPAQSEVLLQDVTWNWRPTEAVIARIDNPNGLETYEGQSFFWIGQGDTTVLVRTRGVGELRLGAHFLMGPSLPGINTRRLLVATDTGYKSEVVLTGGEQKISVPALHPHTVVTLTSQDTPSVAVTGNKDTRPLLVGVKGIHVELDKAAASQSQAADRVGPRPVRKEE
jgi:hypothetical protein